MSVCCSRRDCYTCSGTVIFLYIVLVKSSFIEKVFLFQTDFSDRNILYILLDKLTKNTCHSALLRLYSSNIEIVFAV